ncbi:hypothetical protein GcM1_238113 [Golovinomyces cichoracearum]|uniref:Mtf2-like C-terminal domain-containing protein n=1 Tax=Golovinomyces cichoracearum TaxID=62708 RepID=A0A420IJM8_9PEZI|nr:hypothetical protein GcM1_238113 [Golovinomyces cichoracearum]
MLRFLKPQYQNLHFLDSKCSALNLSLRQRLRYFSTERPDIPLNSDITTQGSDENSSDSKSIDRNEEHKPLIRRTVTTRGVPLPQPDSWKFNPDLLSFGRTPNEDNFEFENSATPRQNNLNSPRVLQKNTNINETDENSMFSDEQEESLAMDENPHEKGSTITPSEKYAFQKIFKEIFEKKQISETVSVFGESFAPNTEEIDKQDLQQDTNDQLSKIISASCLKSPGSIDEIHSALEQYPPALRATAAEALGFDNLFSDKMINDEAESFPTHIDHKKNELEPFGDPEILRFRQRQRDLEKNLEAIREKERERVEGLMRSAATDFDLWKVLENEVFCLIQKLGLEDPPKPLASIPTAKAKSKNKRKNEASNFLEEIPLAKPEPLSIQSKQTPIDDKAVMHETSLPSEPEPPLPQKDNDPLDDLATKHNASPLQLYGPLYPSYLLLALRLLDRSFSQPSPLTLALLPKIKSLGYISRVLGATVQFYNELLLIYRFRQNDFQGMLRLLDEMELTSVVMNNDTLDIVTQMCRVQDRVRQGSQGLGMSLLWGLPNFARGKFSPWRDYLRETLESKQQKVSFPRTRPTILPHSKSLGL